MNKLSHINEQGKASMVDVSAKQESLRIAIAKGTVTMLPATLALIEGNAIAKGDVLATARIAGIMAAKRTAELIPLCHPLAISHIAVDLIIDKSISAIKIEASVRSTGKTGVEMEALTAVSVAALTIYDMAKAVDRAMVISNIRLYEKSGGKSDYKAVIND